MIPSNFIPFTPTTFGKGCNLGWKGKNSRGEKGGKVNVGVLSICVWVHMNTHTVMKYRSAHCERSSSDTLPPTTLTTSITVSKAGLSLVKPTSGQLARRRDRPLQSSDPVFSLQWTVCQDRDCLFLQQLLLTLLVPERRVQRKKDFDWVIQSLTHSTNMRKYLLQCRPHVKEGHTVVSSNGHSPSSQSVYSLIGEVTWIRYQTDWHEIATMPYRRGKWSWEVSLKK